MGEAIQKTSSNKAIKFKDWKERRFYETGAHIKPEEWTYVEHPTHSDWYSKWYIDRFVDTAIKYKIDPYVFLGLGISESGLGNLYPDNPGRIRIDKHFGEIESLVKQGVYPKELLENIKKGQSLTDSDVENLIDYSGLYLKKNLDKYPNDLLRGVQGYSGTGNTIYGGNPGKESKWFGKKLEDINIQSEKPQGNRVLDIADRLRKDPFIKNFVEEY